MNLRQALNKKKDKIEYPVRICSNMSELRDDIDQLDRLIVELLIVRQGFMEQAARIKMDRNMVRDEDRIRDVMEKVILHAKKVGGHPEMIENLYRDMIEWSINYEMDIFDSIK
ncbi:MAG: chorismate mutase [Emcibacter sp.]|nr:chorismate mutase [Emcibacter sp.]